MNQPGEPSVEEILQSIKKVMARDGIETVGPSRTVVSLTDPVQPKPLGKADEVLELEAETMIAFAGDGTIDMEQDNGWSEDSDDDRSESQDRAQSAQAQDDAGTDREDDGPLTGASTRSAMRDNFAALAMLSQPGAQPRIVRSGETSLEGLTRELLRPMLAKWLDENLPTMVEELVKAEIARIAGKRS